MSNSVLSNNHRPWYSFPLVWMLIAIPFSAVIMGTVMIWMAVDTDDGLVADDYYKRGLEINQVIERDIKAAELGLSADIDFDNSARVIKMTFHKGSLKAYPESLQLHLQHTTRENSDVIVQLDHGINNQYIGQIRQLITEGVWYLSLAGNTETGEGWKLDARIHLQAQNLIRLQSDYDKSAE